MARQSLYVTLGLIIVSTVTFVISVYSTYLYLETKKKIISEMHQSSQQSLDSLRNSVNYFIEAYAINEYDILVATEIDHTDHMAIVIEDYKMGKILGTPVYVSGKIRDDAWKITDFDPQSTAHTVQLQEAYYTQSKDILSSSGERLGTVTIYSTDRFLNQELNAIVIDNIVKGAVVAVAFILTLFIGIRFFVLQPLSDIVKVISHSDDDGIPVGTIPDKGPKEIHTLSDTMNTMITSIKDSRILLKGQKEQLQIYNENLEEMVEDRTKELTEANEKLQQLDLMKTMFIASMSHELRTPLNSIIGFSDILIKMMNKNLDDKQLDYLNRIHGAGIHLLGLISDVIDISKIESGRMELVLEEFELKDLVDEAVGEIEHAVKEKGMELHVVANEWPQMHSDRKRLFQCLLNYLSNAVKFSEGGSVTLQIERQDDRVIISVTDTGIGISLEEIPKLFQPFERLESKLKIKAGGTGLGLYLTKKIARDFLKGTVGVESEPGKGSTFWLDIPLKVSIDETA